MRLFYEDEFEAIREAIASSDREFKQVACHLWPSKKPETAYARLKACLNDQKDERLTFGEIIEICRFCDRYDPLHFMCDALSHDRPKPVAKEDELTRLLREYLDARKTTERLAPQIDRLRAA